MALNFSRSHPIFYIEQTPVYTTKKAAGAWRAGPARRKRGYGMVQFSRNGISPVPGAVRPGTARPAATSTAGRVSGKYDQVTISSHEGDPFMLELKSRLSQEVRTATTTGALSTLREEVQAGEYRIDAGNIARKMLLLGEV